MQSQTRNWFLFFGLFFVLMLGHTWLRNKFWPPPRKLTADEELVVREAGRMLSSFSGNGLNDAVTLGVQSAVTPSNALQYLIAVREAKDKVAAVAKAEPPKPVEPPKPQPKPELVALGGDDYLIKATLTTLGAGVKNLTLTPFPQVDRMGLGVKLPDGGLQQLELIPDGTVPSFAIYHYASPSPDDERPLDTLGVRVWKLGAQNRNEDEQTVAFSTDLAEFGVRLTKTFTLKKHELHLGLSVKIERLPDAKDLPAFRYQLAGGRGLPIEGEWYTTVFRNTMVGMVNDKGVVERYTDTNVAMNHTGGSDRYRRAERQIQYAAVAVQYFVSAIVADNNQPNPKFIEFARATVESRPDPKRPFLDDITIRAIAEAENPKPGESVEHKYLLYHGPIKVRLLSQLNGALSSQLIDRYETTLHMYSFTDMGSLGIVTEAIVFCTNVIHAVIGFLRGILPTGWDALCIILVTVMVRGVMFPVSRRQTAAMARTQEQMAKIKPEMQKIKEKFKGDMMAQQQAMSELYKKHGINPMAGLGGCLMVFAQMPVFLGLYFALQESFLFRLKRFLWAPNLTAPDMLFWWTEKIPFISNPDSQGGFFYLGPFFNLLPIVAIALMFVQQKMMTPPAMDDQAKMQQSMMKYMMIFFGFMFYKVPAGLSLYFICSTAWGLAERKLLPKKPTPGSGPAPDASARKNGEKSQPVQRGKAKPKEVEPGKLRSWWDNLLKEASKK
jgi:YidC/Oxa1 family membrane protein insertase